MKFLIVGLGSMGKRRIRNLTHLAAGEISGFDPSAERRAEAHEKYGISVHDAIEPALAWGPDAMVISTPPDWHMAYARKAAGAGVHFFVEAGIENDGIDDILATCRENEVLAAPSCTFRFQPSIKKMKEIIDAGGIGRVLTFTYESGQYLPDWHPWEDYRTFYVSKRETGACREIVPFELTWLNWVMGDVVQVTSMKDKLSDLDCDIDDAYHLLMRYESGAIGHLLVDVLARAATRSCRFVGSEGVLEWSISAKEVRHYSAATKQWETHAEPKAQVEAGYSEMSAEGMYIEEMAAFVDAAKGKAPYLHDFEEDRKILNILYAAERSSETGHHVDL